MRRIIPEEWKSSPVIVEIGIPSLDKPIIEVAPLEIKTPVPGSIVCCNLAGVIDHSGVYIGKNQIVHRDGDGYLAIVSPKEFLARLGGWNPAKCIYVSCNGSGDSVGKQIVAARAKKALNNPRINTGYDIITNNCHQFCQYCLTGVATGSMNNCSFSSLENVAKANLGLEKWCVWHLE